MRSLRHFAVTLLLCLPFVGARVAFAQQATAVVTGTVRTTDGTAVDQANVFLLETLEGIVTGPDGRFEISSHGSGPLTLVVRRLGYREFRRTLEPHQRTGVGVVLHDLPVEMEPIHVRAGQFTAGVVSGATLTPLEVVTTPGASGDVARTIQTLPGVQGGDEGNALFVRGGAHHETRVYLNDAALLNPVQARSPVGTFIGTVDPFLLDGIFFSSGGFGAEWGDALSGVASLQTAGVPEQSSVTGTVGLGTASVSAAAVLPRKAGLRMAANAYDLDALFRVNGYPRAFDPAPQGRDLSGSFIWNYRPGAEIKVFGIDQRTRFLIQEEAEFFSPAYDMDLRSEVLVGNWRELFGNFSSSFTVAYTSMDRAEAFVGTTHTTRQSSAQLQAQAQWAPSSWILLRGGTRLERMFSSLTGVGPGSRGADTVYADFRSRSLRSGLFGEVDFRVADRLRLIGGLRTDFAELTGQRTIDPRLSAALEVIPGATLTAAWGVYHQVPDPLYFDPTWGDPSIQTMRARQAVLGGQLERGRTLARIEIYHKRYSNLLQVTEYGQNFFDEGDGLSRGLDVFVKGTGPWRTQGRVSYSYVSSRRTYAGTGEMASALYDVPHTLTLVLERPWLSTLRTGVAYRYATGRPYSEVAGAEFRPETQHWIAFVAAPRARRLPDWHRLDLSASYVARLPAGLQGVLFAQLTNALNRRNVHEFLYAPDYSDGAMVPSIFDRSLYVGASISRLP